MRTIAMKTGPILILLACLLPLCVCNLPNTDSFDELEVIEWEVFEAHSLGINSDTGKEAIKFYFHPTTFFYGKNGKITYYHDFELTRPLNTNKLVYINGKALSGNGGRISGDILNSTMGDFIVYTESPVKTGDVFTFDQSWFFVEYIQWPSPPKKYKVRIITDSIVFEEDE
jgi:hypothetical protein